MKYHFEFTFDDRQMSVTVTRKFEDSDESTSEYKTNSNGEGLWELKPHGLELDRIEDGKEVWVPHMAYDQILGTSQFSVAGLSQAAAKAYTRRYFKH